MSDDPTTHDPIRLHYDRLAKLMSRAVLAGCATVQIGVELLPDSLTADVLV
ncbi:MAG: hypothetical protein HYV63_30960, partial [Candidatus Schekmanbacteria bacterium]|nr:hypothetical protein [Candidatus Schekmanbacteria bacterium]